MKRILIVDDEKAVRFALQKYLETLDYAVRGVGTLAEARGEIRAGDFAAVLLDVKLPDGSGIDFIDEIRAMAPQLPIILFTGFGTIPMAVKAMKKGCDHFLTKPVDLNELEVLIEKAVQIGDLRTENRALRSRPTTIEPFIGKCRAMQEIMVLAQAAAEHASPVLLRGETGTGKGLMARYIHSRSSFSKYSFVELNCAGLKGEFLESELFGHSKGAFTGAVENKKGLLEKAHKGTLLLDEIGDMDIRVQSKFLKVLEEKHFRPLGRVEERVSDFRLISATHQNLEGLMEKGLFRKDLFFRINTLSIKMPPLRERMDDLEALTAHLLAFITGRKSVPAIEPEALAILRRYPWPGNLRELHNVLERAWILSGKDVLRREAFRDLLLTDASPPVDPTGAMDLKSAEKQHITRVLEETGGHVVEAARVLGVSRATLYRKISQHGLPVKSKELSFKK